MTIAALTFLKDCQYLKEWITLKYDKHKSIKAAIGMTCQVDQIMIV
ncbi:MULTISPECIES: hypothetical protein [unclassified Acetobacterium]|jgi:hypothetical protein|nr:MULTISPECIES: hypothetical protein [unclassified Acetobacterium]MDZ5724021.1 hypothetical protein [Acetobacterium sp. K1/6]